MREISLPLVRRSTPRSVVPPVLGFELDANVLDLGVRGVFRRMLLGHRPPVNGFSTHLVPLVIVRQAGQE